MLAWKKVSSLNLNICCRVSRISESKNGSVESGTTQTLTLLGDARSMFECIWHLDVLCWVKNYSDIDTAKVFFVSWDKNFRRNFQLISIKTHATTISRAKCCQTIFRMNSSSATVIWLYNMFIRKLNIRVQRLENKPTWCCCFQCCCHRRQNVFDKQFPCVELKSKEKRIIISGRCILIICYRFDSSLFPYVFTFQKHNFALERPRIVMMKNL